MTDNKMSKHKAAAEIIDTHRSIWCADGEGLVCLCDDWGVCADLDVTPASLVRAYQRAGRTVPAPIRHRHNEILTGRSSL